MDHIALVVVWCNAHTGVRWRQPYGGRSTRKRAIGPGQMYRLQQQLVPLALDQSSGGQLAPGGGSNRFQCVTIGIGLNLYLVTNEGGAKGTGL